MDKRVAECDPVPLDRAFAVKWYAEGWIDCWNSNRPQRVRDILTEDFVLDSPTTRHTGWHVQGHQATMDYIRYVLSAYPDLKWEVTAPPMFSDTITRAAFTWRGTGHFTGRIDPPGFEGTGRAFDFAGHEVFDFRGDRACRLYATYDLLGLMKQIGLYRRATAGRPIASCEGREETMMESLRALLEAGVANAPDKVILSADGVELTWSGLREQARRVAAALVRDGVKPQDRVIYLGKNDPRYFEVLFGCALAGAVLTPLNWRLAPDELTAIIADAHAAIAFVDSSVVTSIRSQMKAVVALGPRQSWISYPQWCGPAEDPGVGPEPGHIAFQLYTSGTTGRPKGAMFANGTNLRVLLDDISVQWGCSDQSHRTDQGNGRAAL